MLQVDGVAGNHRIFVSQIKFVRFGLAPMSNYTGLSLTSRKVAETVLSHEQDSALGFEIIEK